MYNMHKFGAIEHSGVLANFNISTDESTHPIIGSYDRRKDLKLAENFQSCQSKENQLFWHIQRTLSIIGLRKQLRIMEPYIIDAMVLAGMNTELLDEMSGLDFNITIVLESISG